MSGKVDLPVAYVPFGAPSFLVLSPDQLNNWELICLIMWTYPGIKIYAREWIPLS